MAQKTTSYFGIDNQSRNFAPMAGVAQQQFTMSLLVLAIATILFIMFNVFHYIVA